MAAVPSVRLSTANVGKSQSAQSFSWEAPVPVNQFWDSIDYCKKLELLLQLLREKLAKEEAAITLQSLHETNYARWNGLLHGIYTMQSELGLPEAEQTVREMVDKRPDKSNIGPLHILVDHLVKIGTYVEAEETEKPVCVWMDTNLRLGRDSPQAINARRIIAKALWMQGSSRRAEAEALLAEIREIADRMEGGKFGVYQEEERELNDKMMAQLKGGTDLLARLSNGAHVY